MLIVVHGEDDDFGFRVVAENFLGGFDAAETGQADVHENEVGFGVPAKLNGIESGGGFPMMEVVGLVEMARLRRPGGFGGRPPAGLDRT